MRRIPLLVLATLAVAATLVLTQRDQAQAAQVGVTAELVPAAVTPQPGQKAQVLLIVRNSSGPAAKNLRLSWTNQTEAVVALSDPATNVVESLSKGAEAGLKLDVSAPGVFLPGKIFFRLDYVVGTTPHIATTTLDVNSPVPTKLEDIATVDIKTTLESLDKQHPGTVFLLVTNKSAAELTVVDIRGSGPPFVRFRTSQLSPAKPLTIGPRETKKLEVAVEAPGRVRPGKHLLLFDVHLSWGAGPHLQNAHVITTQQAQIGVVGLSEVLTVVGVPSFLLLPGFLLLVAASILYGFWRPVTAPKDVDLFDAKSPQFWIVAITLSVLMAIAYPHLGGHNYLSDYDLRDVIYVWSISIVIGFLACGIVVYALQKLHESRTPNAEDGQIEILRKLARQHLDLDRELFEFTTGSKTHSGFLLQRRDNAEKVWLSPMIDVQVMGSGEHARELLRRLDAESDPKKLADAMESMGNELRLDWDSEDGPNHPYQVTAEELKGATPKEADRIVRAHQ